METQKESLTMEILRQEMQEVKNDLHSMKDKVDQMLIALMGSDMVKDGGLIGRIKEMERQYEELELRVIQAEKRNDKLEIYQKILWGCGGGVIMGVFTYILQLLFHK